MSISHDNPLTDRQTDRQTGLSASESYKIQVLRGLAIIAVVFIHNTPLGISQVVIRPFLNFCVGLFLFLSGMLSDTKSWKPLKRITKVLIPYVVWTLIYVFLSSYRTPLEIPILFMKKLILGKAAAVMYYVFVYCEFTFLIPLIDKLARSKYRYWGFAIAPLEIVVMSLVPMLLGIEFNKYINAFRDISCLAWFTYFYLGYMMGNKIIEINWSEKKVLLIWAISIVLQMGEGYWYMCLGETNCGTQVKLSSIISGALFAIMAYQFIHSNRESHNAALKKLGDISFGIFFSHLAVMLVLGILPFYNSLVPYPINAIVVIIVTSICVCAGRRVLGKYAKYMAL